MCFVSNLRNWRRSLTGAYLPGSSVLVRTPQVGYVGRENNRENRLGKSNSFEKKTVGWLTDPAICSFGREMIGKYECQAAHVHCRFLS
jgi:hypothetical protein